MLFLSLLEALFALIGFLVCIFVATLVIADWWQHRTFSKPARGTEEQLPQESWRLFQALPSVEEEGEEGVQP